LPLVFSWRLLFNCGERELLTYYGYDMVHKDEREETEREGHTILKSLSEAER